MTQTFAAALCAIIISSPLAAQAPMTFDGAAACQTAKSDAERLACYDRTVPPIAAAIARGELKLVGPEQIRSARRSLFGLTLPRIALFDGDGSRGERDKPADRIEELTTTITSASSTSESMWTLELAEGGTWRTTEPIAAGDPKPGDRIRIKHGAFSAYMANINGRRAVRVRRVG